MSRNSVCGLCTRRARGEFVCNTDGKRKSESRRSPVSRNTPLFSSSHSHRCSSHSTHAYEMGEQAKTRHKFVSTTGRLGVHRSAAGSETLCITDSVTRSSTLLDRGRITESAGVQSRRKNNPSAGLSLRPRTPLWAGCRKFTGIGLGISPVCTTTKIGVRADLWGKSRERYDWSSMENLRPQEPCF